MKLSKKQMRNSLYVQYVKDSGFDPQNQTNKQNRQINKKVYYTCNFIIWEAGLCGFKLSSGFILSSQSAWVTI